MLGKRTAWAASHIFKMDDLAVVKKYFKVKELRFFHLTSLVAFPFMGLPGGRLLLWGLEALDHALLSLFPFLAKFSFKIVFIFQKA